MWPKNKVLSTVCQSIFRNARRNGWRCNWGSHLVSVSSYLVCLWKLLMWTRRLSCAKFVRLKKKLLLRWTRSEWHTYTLSIRMFTCTKHRVCVSFLELQKCCMIHSQSWCLNPKPMRKFWKKETEWFWSCVCLDLSCRHFAAIEESVEICCLCNPRFSSLPPTKSHHKSCTRRDRPAAKPAGSSLAANSVLDNRLVPPGPVAGTSHACASKAMMLFCFRKAMFSS